MISNSSRVLKAAAGALLLVACGSWSSGCQNPDSSRAGFLRGSGFDGSGLRAEGPESDGGDNPALCDSPNEAQVMICHVPEGNPAAKHTLCVGLPGAIHGHGVKFNPPGPGGHGGDYPGACNQGAPVPESSPAPSATPAPSVTPSANPEAIET